MFLHSQTINAFIKRIKSKSREILRNEMGLVCHQSRFEWNNLYIPFHIVVFEHPTKVGFFDHRFYQIGLNKKLIHLTNKEIVDNILRHEWAHFISHLKYGDSIQNHGQQYRDLCRHFGWDKDVYSASINLELETQNRPDQAFDHIRSKIEKLLKLAEGSSGHESEAATLKANELLTKYNIDSLSLNNDIQDEEVCVLRVYETKRVNPQLNALYELLKFFQVSPIISKGKGVSFLEIIGSRHHVELANYMAKFLLAEIDIQYKKFKKQNPELKGNVIKNSYIRGWAKGLSKKLQGQREQFTESSKALIALDKELSKKVSLVYPRLSSTSSKASQFCQASAAQGAIDGMSTNIRKGVAPNKTLLLS